MKFFSTRDRKGRPFSLSEALILGLAPDGGLFVPDKIPKFPEDFFSKNSAAILVSKDKHFIDWPRFAHDMLAPFFEGDRLAPFLSQACERAFSFEIPLRELEESRFLLELFHGPTCAFKDLGAGFLASISSHLEMKRKTVLVATSGDTGGAIGSAFSGIEGTQVLILYPKARVSSRQEAQLTCWQENVKAIRVRGTFDDCQRLVKEAFQSPRWQNERGLLSANSISLARLLPQTVYFGGAALKIQKGTGHPATFVIPTGNLGDAVACFYAREMGFPISKIILATNANEGLTKFYQSGKWNPQKTIPTLANAMDVGNPSNLERLLDFYPNLTKLFAISGVVSVRDSEIREAIGEAFRKWRIAICPHTATAVWASQVYASMNEMTGAHCLVATAHPAKFESIVEPILEKIEGSTGVKPIEIPDSLKRILSEPMRFQEIDASLEALEETAL